MHFHPHAHHSPDQESAEALLTGTLCLMSSAMQSGCPLYVEKVAANLDRLAGHDGLSAELRAVCRRLAAHWEREANRADQDDGHGAGLSDAVRVTEVLRMAGKVH